MPKLLLKKGTKKWEREVSVKFTEKKDSSKCIKVSGLGWDAKTKSDKEKDGWLDYVRYCFNSKSPHALKIYWIKEYENFFVASIEYLENDVSQAETEKAYVEYLYADSLTQNEYYPYNEDFTKVSSTFATFMNELLVIFKECYFDIFEPNFRLRHNTLVLTDPIRYD